MWELNLDCHVKPCEPNACAGEGIVPVRQHQRRLPPLRLRILRLRLNVRLHVRPAQYPIRVQWRMTGWFREKRKIPIFRPIPMSHFSFCI